MLRYVDPPHLKPLRFIGSSRKDLKSFPADVQDEIGRSLLDVQFGETPPSAKSLRGFGGAGVLEVYTVRFAGVVYVLHAFQKKSKRGIKTPKHELDLVRARYRAAEADYRQHGASS